MTVGGWITMLVSVGFVTLLFAWCVGKVLFGGESLDRLHSLDGVDTQDADDPPSDSSAR